MALDMQQALAQYGTLGVLASTIPDLEGKLEQGAQEEWTPDRFFAEIQQTGWWTSQSDTTRQAQILKTTDPGTWQQTLNNTYNRVAAMANEMGASVDGTKLWELAELTLLWGLDDNTLRNGVGRLGASGTGGTYHGAAADLDRQIRASFANQGVAVGDDYIRQTVNQVLAGSQTLASYENQAREAAKSRYPNLSAQLDTGLTVKDIASPYMAQIAQTLEIPETDITLQDRYVQKALTDRDEKGVPRTKPLWQFERELKDDPRWDQTKNAANQTYDLLARVGQDWGFSA